MSVIVDAIRHGVATTVQITNYKRSGETFKNPLSLRAVHDSNGVYRYCVAIQCESPMERLSHEIFTALRTLLPTQVDVGDAPACGRTSGSTQGTGLTLLYLLPIMARMTSRTLKASELTSKTWPRAFFRVHVRLMYKIPSVLRTTISSCSANLLKSREKVPMLVRTI